MYRIEFFTKLLEFIVNAFAFLKLLLPVSKETIPCGNHDGIRCPTNISREFVQDFTGREEILKNILKSLKKTSVTVLTGMGGIGKTQVALKYAHKNKKIYRCFWWIDASTRENILEAYREFSVKNLGKAEDISPEKCVEPVKNWMREHEKWLFVFDNADDIEDWQKYFPPNLEGQRHVLFTAQGGDWRGIAEELELELFTQSEARKFLLNSTKREDDGSLDDLIEELGYLPLGLEQAAAYIYENREILEEGCVYKKYMELLKKHDSQMLKTYRSAVISKEKRSVYATCGLSVQKIHLIASRQLLNILVFLAPDDIQIKWFKQKRKILPEPLRQGIGDELEWNSIVKELTRYSLVSVEKSDSGKIIRIHRLVMKVVRDMLVGENSFEEYAGHALRFGSSLCFFDFSASESRRKFDDLYQHIEAIVSNSEARVRDKRTALLFYFLGRGAEELWGKYLLALKWHEKSQDIREDQFGEEHRVTAKTYHSIAIAYSKNGDHDLALKWHHKARRVLEKKLGKQHKDTAKIYHSIGIVHYRKGDYPLSFKWHKKAKKIRDKILEEKNPERLKTYSHIALIQYKIRNYEYSLKLHRKVLAAREEILGKNNSHTAATYSHIASVYHGKGEYDKSLASYEEARTINENVLGIDHPDTAMIYRNIAIVCCSKGECELAFDWHGKALSICEDSLEIQYSKLENLYGNVQSLSKCQCNCNEKIPATKERCKKLGFYSIGK